MTVSLKHAFTSAKSDGGDSSLVQPSNWNAEHTLTLANNTVLGRNAGTDGAAQELSGSDVRTLTGLATSDSPQFAALNVGHASDTTISRSSAGVIAVEGVTVPLNSTTSTHTAQQIELGHASDTTIARVSAGVVSVEGSNVILASNKLSALSATTSAELAGVISDETGSGALVFGTSPTFTTSTLHPAGAVGSPSIAASGDTNTGLWFPAADTIAVSTAGSERMRIDSAGRVGIGASPATELDLYNASGGGQPALRIRDTSTDLRLYPAGSVAFVSNIANQPLAFGTNNTERLRIDSSGNVGIGTTSPDALLTVNTIASFGDGAASTPSIAHKGDLNTGIWFPAADTIAVSTAGSERMRIDSAGRVGIGASPATELDLYNASGGGQPALRIRDTSTDLRLYPAGSVAFVSNIANQPLAFGTNNTERLRIDSSGNVGIGTTSPGYQLTLSSDSAAKPTTNTWTISSDARLKNVTGEYTKGLDAVCALRPVTYIYNGLGGMPTGEGEHISILAQEAMVPFPECVGTYRGKLDPDGEEVDIYNWNGHALTFALVNSVKELRATITALEARVAALEA